MNCRSRRKESLWLISFLLGFLLNNGVLRRFVLAFGVCLLSRKLFFGKHFPICAGKGRRCCSQVFHRSIGFLMRFNEGLRK
ncbi:uncharacterized protein G2W53_021504 [Senna tora]|uniref:Uncharacterized protein n=1 Tax=Senna tora TaxID=362788 RepID=A0A834TLZ5_9FABA|nr:uncharacterized protein G2W53_021504 [Senna tora]